jgi:hypothetical protein
LRKCFGPILGKYFNVKYLTGSELLTDLKVACESWLQLQPAPARVQLLPLSCANNIFVVDPRRDYPYDSSTFHLSLLTNSNAYPHLTLYCSFRINNRNANRAVLLLFLHLHQVVDSIRCMHLTRCM